MIDQGKPAPPDPETRRTLLSELNERSRWYAAQVWQVPFAYLGIVGLVITQVVDKHSDQLWLAFIGAGVFGLFVLWHMRDLQDGVRRAVLNLQSLERGGGLITLAQYKPRYLRPFFFVVGLAVIASFLASYGLYPGTNHSVQHSVVPGSPSSTVSAASPSPSPRNL